jgi:hypothetical protein
VSLTHRSLVKPARRLSVAKRAYVNICTLWYYPKLVDVLTQHGAQIKVGVLATIHDSFVVCEATQTPAAMSVILI